MCVQEFPVVLLRWADRDIEGRASELVKMAEFRSYVRPTWRTALTPFCTALTGITQVGSASPCYHRCRTLRLLKEFFVPS